MYRLGQFVFDPSRKGVAIALLGVILLAATAMRLYPLAGRSFWFDEAFTWRLIDYPWLEMLDRAKRDNSPPFYYFVLKAWSEVFGTSPVALRSLSLLFGVVTALGAYLFCVEAFGRGSDTHVSSRARWMGLFAAALVAFSALQIRYSWEVRMYALATALTVFSGWALLRALRGGPRRGNWLLYALLATLLAYTHYFGLYTLAGHAVFTTVRGANLTLKQRRGSNPRRTLQRFLAASPSKTSCVPFSVPAELGYGGNLFGGDTGRVRFVTPALHP
jgi:4-amino-4-deoxy-L-arabinose transferase-like glycosyltransferase